jgi:hypothetical protein
LEFPQQIRKVSGLAVAVPGAISVAAVSKLCVTFQPSATASKPGEEQVPDPKTRTTDPATRPKPDKEKAHGAPKEHM